MDNQRKCSLKDHSDSNAIAYCQKCEIYMCNKCNKPHSDLFPNHSDFIIKENINDLLQKFVKRKKITQSYVTFVKIIISYAVFSVLLK